MANIVTSSGGADTLTDDRIGEIAASLGDPDWLVATRRAAYEAYRAAPLPSRVAHLWRYTDPAVFVPANGALFGVARPQVARGFPDALAAVFEAGTLSGAAYSHDCFAHRIELGEKLRRAGAVLCDLHTAARDYPDLVRDRIGQAVGPGFGKFEALAGAVWQCGLFVYIPRGLEVDGTIHLLSEASASVPFLGQRLLVVVDENASVRLVQEQVGGPDADAGASLTNSLVEIFAADSARVHFTTVQDVNSGVASTATWRAHLAQSAQFEAVTVSVGGATAKTDGGALLAGSGAQSNLYGVSYAHRRQHHDNHTVQEHESEDTASDLNFKVALAGRANSVYTGLIRIARDAPRCEAFQENRNLLLSKTAKAETIPELEILNDDVRCSHGATVGKIDPEEVFYLVSRGLDPAAATRLIVGGFAEPILRRTPEYLRERLAALLMERVEVA